MSTNHDLNQRPALEPPEWYAAYLQTYVQRDVRDFARIGDLNTFTRFIRLCAGRSGQLLSKSALPMAIEVKATETVRKELFKGLAAWKNIAYGERQIDPVLIYAGNESYSRSGYRIVGWQAIDSLIQGD
jgi:hypothetical protein